MQTLLTARHRLRHLTVRPNHGRQALPTAITTWATVAASLWVFGLAAEAGPPPAKPAEGGSLWNGPKMTPTAREDVFEFAVEPTFGPLRDAEGKIVSDRWIIRFAAKAACDVCIDLLDGQGRVVRHLAYGVLGPNAPAPLAPNRLDQTIVWDGKDDFGHYLLDMAGCKARVRLGLAAKWDKMLGWHPKNVDCTRSVLAISADPHGVYVLTGGSAQHLRAYGHDGRYLRTLIPFRADKIEDFKRSNLTCVYKLPDGSTFYYPGSGPAEGGGPQGLSFGNHFTPPGPQRMAIANGRIALVGGGGTLTPRRLIHIRTDGSLDNGKFYGPYLLGQGGKGGVSGAPPVIMGSNALAPSPDGKWLYIGGFEGEFQAVNNSALAGQQRNLIRGESVRLRGAPVHAVYKVAWDGDEPALGESFVGEARRAEGDAGHLNSPADLATDAEGNLYIADQGNNRVQVFAPDAKLIRSIPVKSPYAIDVDRQTGCLYVLSAEAVVSRPPEAVWTLRLIKLDANGQRKIELPFEFRGGKEPVFCVDGWAKQPTVWLTHQGGQIALYADRGDRFELVHEFVKEVRDAGHIPFYLSDSWRGYVAADPVRPHLYLLSGGHGGAPQPWKFDVETGQYELCRTFPALGSGGTDSTDDLAFGPTGLLYARTTGFVVRLDPTDWKEVPLDYGEPVGSGRAQFTGGVRFPWPASAHFHMGLGVSASGEILAMGFWGTTPLVYVTALEMPKMFNAIGISSGLKDLQRSDPAANYYQPRPYPGRPLGRGDGNLVCVWDAQGQPKSFDAVKGVPYPSSGIAGDRDGNIYIGYSGDKYGPDGKLIYGRTLVKFSPAGGKFICAGQSSVPLTDRPDRPPEMVGNSCASGDLWTQGLLWSYGGINTIATNTCICPNMRFDVDWYGRTFVTEAHRNSVAVLDTNGNFALRIGRYGNDDSGRGPDSPILVGNDEIALAYCTYLASDGKGNWLYLHDRGNQRIIRVKLDYRRQAVAQVTDR